MTDTDSSDHLRPARPRGARPSGAADDRRSASYVVEALDQRLRSLERRTSDLVAALSGRRRLQLKTGELGMEMRDVADAIRASLGHVAATIEELKSRDSDPDGGLSVPKVSLQRELQELRTEVESLRQSLRG